MYVVEGRGWKRREGRGREDGRNGKVGGERMEEKGSDLKVTKMDNNTFSKNRSKGNNKI